MKVIGIVERSGNYQGNDYHNIMLHCIKLDDNALGELTEIVKIKASQSREVFGKKMTDEDWLELIGQDVFISYDRFANVQSVQIVS